MRRPGRSAARRVRGLLDLRSHFPVLERTAYLNAGTCGPLPRAARTAFEDVWSLAESEGRRKPYWERTLALHDRLRDAYASVLGARPQDVALQTSTREAVVRVVAGLDLAPGDEILTSTEEHPGLLGPLLGARERHGAVVRAAPLADLLDHVGPRTKLVACSHVGWQRGDLAPSFASLPDDVPVLLDGAQGAGAIPIDLEAIGADFYAAAGQKWLCGPTGTGMLYVSPAWQERLAAIGPTYLSFVEPYGPAEAWELKPDARRHDTPALGAELAATAVASFDLLAAYGWETVQTRARELASALAAMLRASGRDVAPRGDTTLVAFAVDDPPAALERLDRAGVAVRDLPGTPWLRASVGAWNSEDDLERLLAAL